MEAWRQELRGMFVEYPGSAERILRALDTDTFDGGVCTHCAYGHGIEHGGNQDVAWHNLLEVRRRSAQRGPKPWTHTYLEPTALENFVFLVRPGSPERAVRRRAELRAECVAHLAESGTTPEPAPQMETEAA